VSTGESKHFLQQQEGHCTKPSASDPIPAIEEVGRYREQAEARAKSVKELAKELAEEKSARASQDQRQSQAQQESEPSQQQPQQAEAQALVEPKQIEEVPETKQVTTNMDSSMQTFRPPPPPQPMSSTMVRSSDRQQMQQQPEVQLQQEQIQYVDNDCCQVAVTTNPTMDSATIKKTTAGSRAKTDTMKSAAHQVENLLNNYKNLSLDFLWFSRHNLYRFHFLFVLFMQNCEYTR